MLHMSTNTFFILYPYSKVKTARFKLGLLFHFCLHGGDAPDLTQRKDQAFPIHDIQ